MLQVILWLSAGVDKTISQCDLLIEVAVIALVALRVRVCFHYVCFICGLFLARQREGGKESLESRANLCGFKHFSACNLGLVCLIVIGLVRHRVSRVGQVKFQLC